jgi:hypothetical protein
VPVETEEQRRQREAGEAYARATENYVDREQRRAVNKQVNTVLRQSVHKETIAAREEADRSSFGQGGGQGLDQGSRGTGPAEPALDKAEAGRELDRRMRQALGIVGGE